MLRLSLPGLADWGGVGVDTEGGSEEGWEDGADDDIDEDEDWGAAAGVDIEEDCDSMALLACYEDS